MSSSEEHDSFGGPQIWTSGFFRLFTQKARFGMLLKKKKKSQLLHYSLDGLITQAGSLSTSPIMLIIFARDFTCSGTSIISCLHECVFASPKAATHSFAPLLSSAPPHRCHGNVTSARSLSATVVKIFGIQSMIRDHASFSFHSQMLFISFSPFSFPLLQCEHSQQGCH